MLEHKKSNVIPIIEKSHLDLSRTFLIAEGTPILLRYYEQPLANKTPQALHAFAKASEGIFLKEMHEINQGLKMKIDYPGLKSVHRIAQKADAEKTGRVEHIFDAARIAFIANRPAQIKRAMDFFSPAKNSRVVDMVDQFAVPDPESRIRRAKIVYELQNGLYSEVQIWAASMLNAFEESHVPYVHQRNIQAELKNSTSSIPYKAYAQLAQKERILGQTRRAIHDSAAAESGLDKFLEKRTFGKIGDTPIVAIQSKSDQYPRILRPDATSGMYVADNSLYADFVTGNYRPTTRDDFLKASHSIAINHAPSKKHSDQSALAPLAHLQIA